MAFTSQDLAAIDAAIASGELTVRSADGKMVTYRSMDELLKARALVAPAVAAQANPCRSVGPRHMLASFADE